MRENYTGVTGVVSRWPDIVSNMFGIIMYDLNSIGVWVAWYFWLLNLINLHRDRVDMEIQSNNAMDELANLIGRFDVFRYLIVGYIHWLIDFKLPITKVDVLYLIYANCYV